jgi:hypothetical protein
LLLDHVPPPASVKTVDCPRHTLSFRDIGPGVGLTVTVIVARQETPETGGSV